MNQPLQDEESLRRDLEAMIEAVRGEIERAIAYARALQGEDSEVARSLDDQLGVLDAQKSIIQTGNPAQLAALKASLPRTMSAVQQSAQAVLQQIGLTATQALAEMSEEQVQTLQRLHDAQSVTFQQYETRSHSRIEALASAAGIDISGYQENRDRLLAERTEAQQKGDRVGVFRGDALLAGNNLFGLVKTHAPDGEIEEAKKQAAEARERFLKEKEIEALHMGRAQGLAGPDLTAFIGSARNRAATELDEENAKNAQRVGLSEAQLAQAELGTNVLAEKIEARELFRMQVANSRDAQAIKAERGEAMISADREQGHLANTTISSIFNNAAVLEQARQAARAIPDASIEADPDKHDIIEQPHLAAGKKSDNRLSL